MMLEFLKRSWAEIDLDKAQKNFEYIKNNAQNRAVFAVVKADAYGHGAEQIVDLYESLSCDAYAVSNIDEALSVRKIAPEKPILVLGYTPASLCEKLADNNISQAIFSTEYANELKAELCKSGKKLSVHIKVDTGMGRIGFCCRKQKDIPSCKKEIESILNESNFLCEGIFTHFAAADSIDKKNIKFTETQNTRFFELVNSFSFKFPFVHSCNSAGTLTLKKDIGNAVRPGIILYGLSPDKSVTDEGLSPILSLKSVVSMVKEIEKGTPISYGRTFKAKRKMTVATVAIGYADGYPRKLSNRGRVLINGEYADIVGRVCMDQLVIDVTNIDGVRSGDTVTLIGNDGENCITANELAEKTDTINYEILCGISQRIPRIYIKNGKITDTKKYILSEENND